VALGASGTIKAAQEVLVAMGEKDGFITPDFTIFREAGQAERVEVFMLQQFTDQHFEALRRNKPRSLPRGWPFCAAYLTR
jgi:exopolyphosphatase/pppGpp-phosphohydrolase